MKKFRIATILLAVLGSLALTAFIINHQIEVRKMDERIAAMPMKSVCVGRFVLDVPQHSVVTYRPATVAGWEISTVREKDEDFELRLQQKEDLLAASKNERDGPSLEVVHKVRSDEVSGTIFMYGRRWVGLIRGGKEVISESVTIDASVRSKGISYEFKALLRRPEQLARLEKMLGQIQAVDETEIPLNAGFCFDRGLLRDPIPVEDHEYASLFLGTQEHPDLAISLSTFAGGSPSQTLLERHQASSIQREYASRFHDLRVGARVINGLHGQEVLQRVDEFSGVKLHDFMWESIADQGDVFRPKLTLELGTGLGRPGAPVNSSLSDVEALALWERISSSLRPRPLR